jgi:hypothetical protein
LGTGFDNLLKITLIVIDLSDAVSHRTSEFPALLKSKESFEGLFIVPRLIQSVIVIVPGCFREWGVRIKYLLKKGLCFFILLLIEKTVPEG